MTCAGQKAQRGALSLKEQPVRVVHDVSQNFRENPVNTMVKFARTLAAGAVLSLGVAGASVAQDLKFFTIGTGGTAYTYYPVGGVIANADSGIDSVADLAGKRVSLDEPGSGTYVDALLIMEANGLGVDDVTAEALKGNAASDALRNGRIDAFFVVAGYPTGSLVELASAEDIKLVPISGDGADALTDEYGFFAQSEIPAGTYEGVGATPTVAVGAQWFTSAEEDEDLIYEITKALWNDNSRKLLDVGHAKGKTITPETALSGVGVPLHAGAERFYRDVGLLN